MKKWLQKILVPLLVLIFICCAVPALASGPTSVDPSDTLEVCIKTAAGTTTLHTYALSEMEAMADDDVYYSGLDSIWTVQTVATGVYLEDLLADVAQYSSLDVREFERLQFYSSDSESPLNRTYKQLFGTKRYYFPDIHEADGGIKDGEVACAYGKGVLVEPMLSISAELERLPEPSSSSAVRYYNPECYTLLFGTTESELDNLSNIVGSYRRGIYRMVIDMGNVSESVAVTGISLDRASANVTVGKSVQLSATVSPTNASNQELEWTSNNMSVATVSPTGLVTGVGAGTAVITAVAADNNSITQTCTVTVRESDIAVTGISLSKNTLRLTEGNSKKLTATVKPGDATDRTVIWSSSNTKVATVDSNGNVKGVSLGKAIITAEVGGYSDDCTVTVTDEIVDVTGVSLNKTTLSLGQGDTLKLVATVSPSDATETDVLWSSSQPGVASVDTDGVVTAQNSGTSVITVTTEDGAYTAKCTVTVSETAATFSDIVGNWAQSAIEQMSQLGFVTGGTDGAFRPNASITRGEFLSILIRVMQETKNVQLQSGSTFADTTSHWAKQYIETAVFLKVTTGYSNGKFGPNDLITREQIAVMLANASGYNAASQPAVTFLDKNKISSWATKAVAYTVSEGLFTGYSDNTFGPKNNATRAEVATLLLRFYEKTK